MLNKTDILSLAEKYFIQQAELYGTDFYVEPDFLNNKNHSEIQSLEAFKEKINNCQNCALSKSRNQFVFGAGNPHANLMCIGEAPGYEEDQTGEPFVGEAGQLLNRILAAIGFQREEVFIANILKCRPPGNRDPEPDEISECLLYLKEQIALIKPKLILALGRVAAQNILGIQGTLGSLRGSVHKLDHIQVIVTYHPAALLRNAQWKRQAWEDVQKLRKIYDQVVGDKSPLDLKN